MRILNKWVRLFRDGRFMRLFNICEITDQDDGMLNLTLLVMPLRHPGRNPILSAPPGEEVLQRRQERIHGSLEENTVIAARRTSVKKITMGASAQTP